MTPELERILTYKSMWAMCVIGKEGRMRATHYATCLVGGRSPLWGLWSVNGRFVGFYASRDQAQQGRPFHSWRRVMSRWKLNDDSNMDAKKRRVHLSDEMKSPLPDGEIK